MKHPSCCGKAYSLNIYYVANHNYFVVTLNIHEPHLSLASSRAMISFIIASRQDIHYIGEFLQ